ncbi:hypothetical protein [Tahibacter sp.]|uniref:hypothetical protein n=1 Tax=Tahibacter sp. TaxID=2056211 RepID=UPI0028C41151|nr:hypothetical protein [Tahibacter sp.]
MEGRATPHRAWVRRPGEPWDSTIRGKESISDLRAKLLHGDAPLARPTKLTVVGTLFPSALLSSGWWERSTETKIRRIRWRDGVQEWLFHGFHQWGPSWDFTWNIDQWEVHKHRPYFIAQIGDGDEANSLPVLIPREKAESILGEFERWGGVQAEVTGLLGRREHFEAQTGGMALELFGGLLDYCLWLNADDAAHIVEPLIDDAEVYSAYLWKCIAAEKASTAQGICLNDVYFVWEHANLVDADAVAYALDALDHKQRYLETTRGPMKLIQKSCGLVPGDEVMSDQDIYAMLLGRRTKSR